MAATRPDYVLGIHDFKARNQDELNFSRGEYIEVIEDDSEFGDKWYIGKNLETGAVGLFPSVFTTSVANLPPHLIGVSPRLSSEAQLAGGDGDSSFDWGNSSTQTKGRSLDRQSLRDKSESDAMPSVSPAETRQDAQVSPVVPVIPVTTPATDGPRTTQSSQINQQQGIYNNQASQQQEVPQSPLLASPSTTATSNTTSSYNQPKATVNKLDTTKADTTATAGLHSPLAIQTNLGQPYPRNGGTQANNWSQPNQPSQPSQVQGQRPHVHGQRPASSQRLSSQYIPQSQQLRDLESTENSFTPVSGSTTSAMIDDIDAAINEMGTTDLTVTGPESVDQWEPVDVQAHFLNRGFDPVIAHKFVEQEITGAILLELDRETLKELNIASFGTRFEIDKEIKRLNGQSTPSSNMSPDMVALSPNGGSSSSVVGNTSINAHLTPTQRWSPHTPAGAANYQFNQFSQISPSKAAGPVGPVGPTNRPQLNSPMANSTLTSQNPNAGQSFSSLHQQPAQFPAQPSQFSPQPPHPSQYSGQRVTQYQPDNRAALAQASPRQPTHQYNSDNSSGDQNSYRPQAEASYRQNQQPMEPTRTNGNASGSVLMPPPLTASSVGSQPNPTAISANSGSSHSHKSSTAAAGSAASTAAAAALYRHRRESSAASRYSVAKSASDWESGLEPAISETGSIRSKHSRSASKGSVFSFITSSPRLGAPINNNGSSSPYRSGHHRSVSDLLLKSNRKQSADSEAKKHRRNSSMLSTLSLGFRSSSPKKENASPGKDESLGSASTGATSVSTSGNAVNGSHSKSKRKSQGEADSKNTRSASGGAAAQTTVTQPSEKSSGGALKTLRTASSQVLRPHLVKQKTSAFQEGIQQTTAEESSKAAAQAGWMHKRGGTGPGVWKSRYFTLHGTRLSYFSNFRDTKERGLIDITGHRVVPIKENEEKLLSLYAAGVGAGKFCFKIVPPAPGYKKGVAFTAPKTHYFALETEKDMREWMAAMMRATIERDETVPVLSTCNTPTVSLSKAQDMMAERLRNSLENQSLNPENDS